jgi:hypothetical protein
VVVVVELEVDVVVVVVEADPVVVEVVESLGLLVVDVTVGLVVEVLVVDGVLDTGTTPHGPTVPVRCGTAKGFVGLPGWVAPNPKTRSRTAATALPVRTEPTAAGLRTATRRSRADSLWRRRSSSGVSCVRWASQLVYGAVA